MSPCTLCPRDCRVQRRSGELGLCNAGNQLLVAAAFPHFGEEPPLSGQRGSGAIFISWCNLLCQFCQSWEVNHQGEGEPVSARELAEIMLDLQGRGCHNINFVTPTHYAPQLIAALPLAIEQGFRLPLVYNCGGYESLEVIRLLDGIIDIYLPDIKFLDPAAGERYLDGAADYPEVVRTILQEMHRQVGDLRARCARHRPARPHRPTSGDARHGAGQPSNRAVHRRRAVPSDICEHHGPISPLFPGRTISRDRAPHDCGGTSCRRGDGPWARPAPGLIRILIDYGQSKSADDYSQYWHYLAY